LSLREAISKYRAAVDIRNELDSDFVLTTRYNTRGAVYGSLKVAIARGDLVLKSE